MSQIIVALDSLPLHQAIELAQNLTGRVWGFKVNDLLLECGVTVVKTLRAYGYVFADPKLHDIPNTVHNSTRRLVTAGANFVSVHATGGQEMCGAAVAACGYSAKVLGVTMLTSLSEQDVRDTYRGYPLHRFSEVLSKAGVPGVVCSGREADYWKLFNLIRVVPGVRPLGAVDGDDQKRVCTRADAEFLVIGRPILNSSDPIAAVEKIKEELALPPAPSFIPPDGVPF